MPESNSNLPPGSSYCQCPVCEETFKSEAGFEAHRIGDYENGDRRCLSPKQMRARGFSLNEAGYWVTRVMSAEEKERIVRNRKKVGAA